MIVRTSKTFFVRALAREKISAVQCEFLFPARKGALTRQIRDGGACGRAAVRALARENFRVRTKKMFGFVLKNTANPLAPAVGGAGRRGGARARRANDARP